MTHSGNNLEVLQSLGLSEDDFAPEVQGFLPLLNGRGFNSRKELLVFLAILILETAGLVVSWKNLLRRR
jgi:hypothetical protein